VASCDRNLLDLGITKLASAEASALPLDFEQEAGHFMPMTRTSRSPKLRLSRKVWPVRSILLCLAFCLSGCDRSSDSGSEATDGASKLEYGTKVSFAESGNSNAFKVSGWSKAEEKFTWSEGTSSVLKMAIAPTNDPIVLKMTIAALIKEPELPFQPVEVSANGQKIADWQVGNTAEFAAPIPRDIATKGGMLTITFKTPKATSPKTLGLSADTRTLGICCLYFELSKG
jgi:hypothetical protein